MGLNLYILNVKKKKKEEEESQECKRTLSLKGAKWTFVLNLNL